MRISYAWSLDQAVHEVSPSVFSLWSLRGHDRIDDVLYVPGTYPGGLVAVDVGTGAEVFAFNTQQWLYDVKVLGRNAVVASTTGLGVIDLDTQALTPLVPGFVSGNALFKARDGVHAIVGDELVQVNAAGAVASRTPHSLGSGGSPRIVDVERDRALLLVSGQGLRWVDR